VIAVAKTAPRRNAIADDLLEFLRFGKSPLLAATGYAFVAAMSGDQRQLGNLLAKGRRQFLRERCRAKSESTLAAVGDSDATLVIRHHNWFLDVGSRRRSALPLTAISTTEQLATWKA
jgi:hypothetical protein